MSNPEIRKGRQAAALIPRGLPDRINDMLTSSHRKFSYSFAIISSPLLLMAVVAIKMVALLLCMIASCGLW